MLIMKHSNKEVLEKLRELVKQYPNDYNLGAAVRVLVNSKYGK